MQMHEVSGGVGGGGDVAMQDMEGCFWWFGGDGSRIWVFSPGLCFSSSKDILPSIREALLREKDV